MSASIVFLFALTVAAARLTALARARKQRDRTPDYLGLCGGRRFERDGFCFTVSLDREDGMASFTVMFQNRFAAPAVACVSLRPAGSNVAIELPRITCGPAAFGVIKFPVAIPARHQGKTVRFAIAAEIDYPLDRGREVCFRKGRNVPRQLPGRVLPRTSRGLPRFLAAPFLKQASATIRLTLPCHVAEYFSDDNTGHVEVLWSLDKNDRLGHAARVDCDQRGRSV